MWIVLMVLHTPFSSVTCIFFHICILLELLSDMIVLSNMTTSGLLLWIVQSMIMDLA